MIQIELNEDYIRDLKSLCQREPDLKEVVEKKANWFAKKPADERLENHPLGRDMAGLYAFRITGDIRIIYKWLGKNRVRFLAVGTHEEVYVV